MSVAGNLMVQKNSSVVRRVVAPVCLLVFAASVGAQQTPVGTPVGISIARDTGTTVEGEAAGIAAANERSVAGRAMGGFIGGLPIGFLGMPGLQGDPAGAIGIGVGATIIGASWKLGGIEPPQTQGMSERGRAYQSAYTTSYRDRLLERRRKAALLGGVAGGVTGLIFIFMLLSSINT